jgi:nucleoside 2-deoxyribosyltransferase
MKQLTIYLAGPLFTKYEWDWNEQLAHELEKLGYKTFLHQRDCTGTMNQQIFVDCIAGVETCDVVLANVDGTDADSGTAFEVGYAHAKNKVVILYRTDFRKRADDGDVNLMLARSCDCFLRCSTLAEVVVAAHEYLQTGCSTFAQSQTTGG